MNNKTAAYMAHVADLPLCEALWWYIENTNEDDPWRTEMFFELRGRMRTADPRADFLAYCEARERAQGAGAEFWRRLAGSVRKALTL